MTCFVPLGDTALRAPLPTSADPRAVLASLRRCPGVVDAVVTEAFACVYFDPARAPALERIDAALNAYGDAELVATPRLHVVRLRYDGEDLAAVASQAGLSVADVIHLHASREYVVRTLGFLPGFAYLGDNDPRLDVPRRPAPRARVPPNAVAVAARYTGIYPFASPGGWNLVGTAIDFVAFDVARGATFALGDRVRFEEAR